MSAPRIIGIVSHLSAKNYRNWWKFDEVLTKTNLLSFFWDTVYYYCYYYYCYTTTINRGNDSCVKLTVDENCP